jgi:mannose-6-phosphate isomerase
VWGGRALERLGKRLPRDQHIGESWEIADLPESIEGGQSIIANGELAGVTLRRAITDYSEAIMGAAANRLTPWGGFPLLIKYLDARENLSVQVHPDAAYAKAHAGAHLKSEAWVIVDAQPGAVIYKGLRRGVTRDSFARNVAAGDVVQDLESIEVRPGDCHYLPSGTCHALGAGILVAEVQTPSDTTFRVYDWGRTGRELHVEQALECMFEQDGRPRTSSSQPRRLIPNPIDGVTTTDLCETEYFSIERVDAAAGASFPIVTQDLPVVWMMLSGAAEISGDFEPQPVNPGDSALIPAAANGWQAAFSANSRLLLVRLPSPLRNMLA